MKHAVHDFRTDFLIGPRRVATSWTRVDLLGESRTELFSMPAALPGEAEGIATAFERTPGKPGSLTHLVRASLTAEGYGYDVRADYSLASLAAEVGQLATASPATR